MWRPEVDLSCQSSGGVTLIFEAGCLIGLELPSYARQSDQWGSILFLFPQHWGHKGVPAPVYVTLFLPLWVLGVKLRSSSYQGQPFSDQATFPAPSHLNSLTKIDLFCFMCMSFAYMRVWIACVFPGAHRGQKKVSDPLGTEVMVGREPPRRCWETEHGFSGRITNALTTEPQLL